MPRTALGRARLARCDDFVSRPLDVQYYHGVLKFQNSWGSISRSTNVSRLERDRGWRVVQNRYPVALEPDAVRNLRGFDGLGRVRGLVAKRGLLVAAGRSRRSYQYQ